MEQLKNNKLFDYWKKLQSKNSIFVYILVLVCIPFLLLSFFNQPATDDYYFVNLIQKYGIKDANIWLYQNWGGRYIANGILSFCPLYFGQLFWYKIIPILLFIFWILSSYFFIDQLFFKLSVQSKNKIASIFILIFLALTDEVTSAFYWIVGGITHFLPLSFILLSVGFYLKYKRLKRPFNLFFSCVFLALAMGCNENIVVTSIGLLALIIYQRFFVAKQKNYSLFLLFVIALIFGGLELFAPGNFSRADTIPVQNSVVNSVIKTVIHSIITSLKWLPKILLGLLILLPISYQILEKTSFKKLLISPIISIFLPIVILIPNLFLGFYLQDNILPDRSFNAIIVLFTMAVFYSFLCFLNYYQENRNIILTIPKGIQKIITAVFILALFSNSSILFAFTDIVNGKASKYNNEIKNRIELIENSSEEKIVVPALKNKPKTIYSEVIMGLTDDPENWKNEDISIYYKKEIVVKPTDSVFVE